MRDDRAASVIGKRTHRVSVKLRSLGHPFIWGICVLMVAAWSDMASPDMAFAQSRSGQRQAKIPPVPLDASFPSAVAQCGMAFGNMLTANVSPALSADLARTAAAINAVTVPWPGRWLASDPTGKQAKADALAAAEARTQQRICTERTKRSGRVSCAKWQDAQPPASPPDAPTLADIKPAPVPAPVPAAVLPPVGDELRDLKLLSGFVAAKGQLIEFGRNGRLEGLMKRSTADLVAYVSQPAHPALCNGVPEMLEFHIDRMEPVQSRLNAVAELAARTRDRAERRVAAALKLPESETRGKPLSGLVNALGQLMLPTDVARDNAKLADVWVQLRRLVDAGKSLPWIAEPPETQVAAVQAVRALEAAFYADAQKARAATVDRSTFGTMAQIRDAHTAQCTCSE